MSQPKRYNFWMYQQRSDELGLMARMTQQECEYGDWIYHSDYAALAAENERLRKAGDAMAKWFNDGGFYGFGFQEAWLAAKEGRDAK